MKLTNPARRKLTPRPRNVLRSASMLLALLFVLLRPVCEVFAASGDQHAPAVSGHSAAQAVGAYGSGRFDDGICCESVDAQALTVPATALPPSVSPDAPAAPSSALRQALIPIAPPTSVRAQRDPAPPRSYHARSLRRLD